MSALWRNRWGRRSTVALSVIGVAVAAAVAERPSAAHGASSPFDTSSVKRASATTPAVAKLEDLSDAFATIAARVKPSVVYIIATQNGEPVVHRGGRQRPQQAPGLDQIPPEFRQFFQMPGGGGGADRRKHHRRVAPSRPARASSSRPTGTSSPTTTSSTARAKCVYACSIAVSTRPRSLAAIRTPTSP